jgi:hypothetical protein
MAGTESCSTPMSSASIDGTGRALRHLIQADATLDVVDRFVGKMERSKYFGKYTAPPWK